MLKKINKILTYVDWDVDYKLSGIGLNKLMFDFCKGYAQWFTPAMFLSVLGAIAALLFLCFAAGHRRGREEIVPNLIDKMPYDLFAGICFMLAVFAIIAIEELSYGFQYEMRVMLAFAVIAGCYILAMSFIMSTITRVKMGAFWENTVIWRIGGKALRWCWKWVKRIWLKFIGMFGSLFGSAAELIHSLPLIWKGAMVILGAAVANTFLGLFLMLVGRYNALPLLLFLPVHRQLPFSAKIHMLSPCHPW